MSKAKKQIREPLGFPVHDDEERELIESYESHEGPFESLLTPESKRELEEAARATLEARRSKISLRVRMDHLEKLKARAKLEGLPYQTLINSLIHKYVSEPSKERS